MAISEPVIGEAQPSRDARVATNTGHALLPIIHRLRSGLAARLALYTAILGTVVTAVLTSYMFAYEYLGYPMDRRRFSFSQKKRFLRSHLSSVMGFGLGNLVVASIPVINLLFIPAAVVGGTLLFLDVDSTGKVSD